MTIHSDNNTLFAYKYWCIDSKYRSALVSGTRVRIVEPSTWIGRDRALETRKLHFHGFARNTWKNVGFCEQISKMASKYLSYRSENVVILIYEDRLESCCDFLPGKLPLQPGLSCMDDKQRLLRSDVYIPESL